MKHTQPTLEVSYSGQSEPSVSLHVPNKSFTAAFKWLKNLGYEPKRVGWSRTFGFTRISLETTEESLEALSNALWKKGYFTETYSD